MKGFMESFNHPFGKEACKKRLLEEYKKYGELIVAFDYDNTIFDYHNNGELQINQSSVLPKSYKPYYNILLDDRAGLEESYEILKYVVDEIIKLN